MKQKFYVTIDSAFGPFETEEEAIQLAQQLLSTKAPKRTALVLKQTKELRGS